MASGLRKEITKIESEIEEVEDEIEVIEVRMVRAKGQARQDMERKLQNLDDRFEELDTTLEKKKKALKEAIAAGDMGEEEDDDAKDAAKPGKIDISTFEKDDDDDDEDDDDYDEDSDDQNDDDDAPSGGEASSLLQRYFSDGTPYNPEGEDKKPQKESVSKNDDIFHELAEKREEERRAEKERKEEADREAERQKQYELELLAEEAENRRKILEEQEKQRRLLQEKEQKDTQDRLRHEKEEKERKKRDKEEEAKRKEEERKRAREEEERKRTKKMADKAAKKEKERLKKEKEEAEKKAKKEEAKAASELLSPESKGGKRRLSLLSPRSSSSPGSKSKSSQRQTAGASPRVSQFTERRKEMRKNQSAAAGVGGTSGSPRMVVRDENGVPTKSCPELGDSGRKRRQATQLTDFTVADVDNMDEEAIKKHFEAFVDSMGITDQRARRVWDNNYTMDQKRILIKTLVNKNKLTLSLIDEITPDAFVTRLNTNSSAEQLETLLTKIQTAPLAWVAEFATSGRGWLWDCMGFTLYKANKRKGEELDQREMERLQLLILCVDDLVNCGAISPENLVAQADSVRMLVLSLQFVDTETQSIIMDLLAAVCIFDPKTSIKVQEGLQYFHTWKLEEFRDLIDELDSGEDLNFKVSLMAMINCVIVTCDNLGDRVKVRQLFMAEGIGRVIDTLKEEFPDPELTEQMTVFEAELDNDLSEAHISKEDYEQLADPVEVVTKLWEKLVGSGVERSFVSTLKSMMDIGVPEEGSVEVWASFAKVAECITELVSDTSRDLSKLNHEELLLACLGAKYRSSLVGGGSAKVSKSSSDSKTNGAMGATPASAPAAGPAAAAVAAAVPDAPAAVAAAAPPPPPPPPGGAGPPPPPPPPGGGPPPPPPPPGGGPPPPPPPPGGGGGPPPPPGMMGGGMAARKQSPFYKAERAKCIQWRWNAIPERQVGKTVFNGMEIDGLNIDSKLLERTFAVKVTAGKSLRKSQGVRGAGPDGEDGEDEAEGGPTSPRGEVEVKPKLLDPQRCQVIEIIMKRLGLVPSLVEIALYSADMELLTVDKMSELMSLFPAKSIAQEREMLTTFAGSEAELSRPERFLLKLVRIPAIESKLASLIFCSEVEFKIKECEQNVETVLKTIESLKGESVVKVLQLILAIGHHLNNQQTLVSGFKFSSLLKLVDVKAPVQEGRVRVSLLHFIAVTIEQNYPDLLTFTTDVPHIAQCSGAIGNVQQDIRFLKNGLNKLKMDIEASGKDEQMAKLLERFQTTSDQATAALESFEQAETTVKEALAFFGEQNINEVPQFFESWDSFFRSFNAAVKFNRAQEKKRDALKKKEDERMKKEEEENVMNKVVDTLRESQANLRVMAHDENQKIDGFFSARNRGQARGSRARGTEGGGAAARRKREKKDQEVTSIVDDILSNNSCLGARPTRRSGRGETGVVRQVGRELRDKKTYDKIRERGRSRESAEDAAEDIMSGLTKKKTATNRVSRADRASLSRQISTRLPRNLGI